MIFQINRKPRFMTRSRFLSAIATLSLSTALISCGPEESATSTEASGTYQVTATVGMIADIVREVAGNRAEVKGIIGEGVDPHVYKPTSTDVKALQAADVVFYNGLQLEGKMGDVLVRLARTGKPAATPSAP